MIKFNFLLLTLVFISLIFLSGNKIHGSSIGTYNTFFYGSAQKDKDLLYGEPRLVRSDEWMVTSPLAISQSKNHFNSYNPLSNGGQELSLPLDIPTNHWSTFFKLENWAFFFLPIENAFAFRWWIKGILLLLAVYLVMFKLTREYLVSIGCALITVLSPYIQWWYSGSAAAVETTTYGLLSFLCILELYEPKTLLKSVLLILLLTYSAVAFILLLYPPFQIVITICMLFSLIGIYLNNHPYGIDRQKLIHFFIHLAVASVLIVSILFVYYFSFKDIIYLLSNTSYPGKRVSTGGEFTLLHFFAGFFNIYFQDSPDFVPSVFINKSEGASFLMFYPFLIPTIIIGLINQWRTIQKLNYLFITLIIFLLLATCWIFFGIPKIVSHLLFFHLTTENRMILGIGISNYILATYYLTQKSYIKESTLKFYAYCSALIAALLYIAISYNLLQQNYSYLKSDYTLFFGNFSKLILICLTVFISVYTLIAKHKKTFFLITILFSFLSVMTINPIYRGLEVITKSEISNKIQTIVIKDPESYWAVYDNLYLSNFLTANNAKTITGVSMYPKFNLWTKLDPNRVYRPIYNRYAHITFSEIQQPIIAFQTVTPDYFVVRINPCDPQISQFHIKYVVFNSLKSYPCLEFVEGFKELKSPFYIYRINP